ncbi:hypothetical protein B0T14DRAFT_569600 [Immersiella caudata]|uniref:Uncharacterized protein n=1 Tax=Immersiella caudata TaxID=314043 RepID=A0AA39WDU3_9PEZI|nr:hypothetical protein B0T14DRAFT_569600 [Immersiella caudata]
MAAYCSLIKDRVLETTFNSRRASWLKLLAAMIHPFRSITQLRIAISANLSYSARRDTVFATDVSFSLLTMICLVLICIGAIQISNDADIETEIHKYVLGKIDILTDGSKKASPRLGDVFDETVGTLEAEPETVIPSLEGFMFRLTDLRPQLIVTALEYINTLRRSLKSLDPKPGRIGRREDLGRTERRALAVNVSFLDIADT